MASMDKNTVLTDDLEKSARTSSIADTPENGSTEVLTKKRSWSRPYDSGVEFHGGAPIPLEEQTDTQYLNVFTIYSTSLCSLLPYAK